MSIDGDHNQNNKNQTQFEFDNNAVTDTAGIYSSDENSNGASISPPMNSANQMTTTLNRRGSQMRQHNIIENYRQLDEHSSLLVVIPKLLFGNMTCTDQ